MRHPSRQSMILGRDGKPIRIMMSAYDAAGTGRRATGWNAPSGSANALLTNNLQTLRNRSREGARNNPWIGSAIEKLVANEIGTGIVPRSRCSNLEIRAQINDLWAVSARELDADGVLDIYGLQTQWARCRRTSGEVFVRLRSRLPSDGLAVPLQIQVLEPDYCPETENRQLPNGNTIMAGIEFSPIGKRVGYWMYRQHPGESLLARANLIPIPVPADRVLHSYIPLRPGQIRGEPETVRGLLKARTFDLYDDAELVRKQTRAPFTGAITKPPDEYTEDDWQFDPVTGQPIVADAEGIPTATSEPGTFLNMLPGEDVKLFEGDDTGTGYADFMRQQLLAICGAFGVPYELVTGDWSKVNDRLVRAILNEFRRPLEAVQDHMDVHQILQPIWDAWLSAAVLAGRIRAPGYADQERRRDYHACEWRPHGWQYVNPEQDVNAKLLAIAGGLTSRDAEVAKTGWDAEEIDQQNVESERRLRELRRAAGLPETDDEA